MFDDQDLGFFANFLGIFIFVLVIAYHYVMADPRAPMPISASYCHESLVMTEEDSRD